MSADSRVPMLSPEEAEQAAERVGLPVFLTKLNIFRLLLRRPTYAKGFSDALGYLLAGKALDHRLRELVIMRIAWQTGSDYEWTQHWELAQRFGVSSEDLLAIRQGPGSDRFDELDRVVLEATDQAVRGETIAPEVLSALSARLGHDATLELVASIGCWAMVSTILRSLEVPLEDGMRSWPPDGVGPDRA